MAHTRRPRSGLPLRTLAGRSLAGLAALATLAACGEDTTAADPSDGAPTADSTPATGEGQEPACADTWVEGKDLAKKYSGCLDADGELVEPTIIQCSSGQRLVTHDDAWWAVRGHTIGHAPEGLKENKDFKRVLRPCLA